MTKTINIKNVEKHYKLYENQKERILDLLSPRSHGQLFHALRGVDFEAEAGDIVGFIGINGSGKSTLSNIVAGIVPPSKGTVEVNGQASLIAVAAGLNNDLTGRENIELKCLMLGFSKEEIRELEPDIIAFSELESFIDQPVKSYSSGMKSRLGFAISVTVDPDILIIDEALSVGDRAFGQKSLAKMEEFKEQGKTMIFVSHSINQVKNFCNKILWLEFGRIKAFGEVNDVLPLYESFLNIWQKMSKEERDNYRNRMLAGKAEEQNTSHVFLDNLMEDDSSNHYQINPISRLAHLKGHSSYIYNSPHIKEDKQSTDKYKHRVYYVKREADYHFDKYYLLSTKPSGIDGVIGWIKATEVTSHIYTIIDNDKKRFKISGNGRATIVPWGGNKQKAYDSLEKFAGKMLIVEETAMVGQNIWYGGQIESENKHVWIHATHLINVNDLEDSHSNA